MTSTITRTSWETLPLAEVAEIERNAIAPEQIAAGSKYVGLEDINSSGQIENFTEVSPGEIASTKFHFSSEHVLYGKLRPYLSKIALPSFEGICSTDILPVLPGERLDRRFLCYFLRQPHVVEFATRRSTGANLPRLSPKRLAEFEIPLPALSEQRRIADILDKADAIRRKRQEAIGNFDDLSDSLFNQLSRDAEVEPKTIAELIDSETLLVHKDGNYGGSYPRKHEFGADGIPFLSAKHVDEDGSLLRTDVPRLNEEKARTLPFGWIERGDVLLAHNATVGPVALYQGDYEEALIGTSLTCYRPNPDHLRSEFLFAALRGSHFQRQLQKEMSQTTRNQVPITAQRKLTIHVPHLDLQQQFSNQLSRIHDLRKKHSHAATDAQLLFHSLVQRAFKGEL